MKWQNFGGRDDANDDLIWKFTKDEFESMSTVRVKEILQNKLPKEYNNVFSLEAKKGGQLTKREKKQKKKLELQEKYHKAKLVKAEEEEEEEEEEGEKKKKKKKKKKK